MQIAFPIYPAIPKLDNLDAPLTPVPGDIPSPLERPSGCVFRTRCPHVEDRCSQTVPTLTPHGADQETACLVMTDPNRGAA